MLNICSPRQRSLPERLCPFPPVKARAVHPDVAVTGGSHTRALSDATAFDGKKARLQAPCLILTDALLYFSVTPLVSGAIQTTIIAATKARY